MPTVRVRGLETPVEVEPGQDLMTALRARNVNLLWGPWAQAFQCRGIGLCSLCKVRVEPGATGLTPRTKREEKRLKRRPADWRLACQVRFAKADAEVTIEAFPLVRAEEKVSPEALRRALLPAEERMALEEQDRTAERQRIEQEQAARRLGTRRRLRLPFTKKADGDRPSEGRGKKGLAARRRKGTSEPGGDAPTETARTAADVAAEKPKRRFAVKGKT